MSLPFLAQEPTVHSVGGTEQKFWPLSLRMTFRLRGIAKPIAKAVAAFLSTASRDDTGSEHSTVRSTGGEQTHITVTAISPDLAKVRFEQRQSSIESFMEGVLSEPAMAVLADMIMDSMREAYPNRKSGDIDEFCKTVPAPIAMEMLAGVAKANAKLFDPLKDLAAQAKAAVQANLAPQSAPQSTSTAAMTPSG